MKTLLTAACLAFVVICANPVSAYSSPMRGCEGAQVLNHVYSHGVPFPLGKGASLHEAGRTQSRQPGAGLLWLSQGVPLHEVTRKLDFAATTIRSDLGPFRYKMFFGSVRSARKFTLSDRPSDIFISLIRGSYESPCDTIDYLSVQWPTLGDDRGNYGQLVAGVTVFPFLPPPPPCAGTTLPSKRPFWELVRPQPPADHPPLSGWSIDFPQLFALLKRNQILFRGGVNSMVVTTARYLKLEDRRQISENSPCSYLLYNENTNFRRLADIDDGRAVMEVIEAARPFREFTGHYLIIDAHTGAKLESGFYRKGNASIP